MQNNNDNLQNQITPPIQNVQQAEINRQKRYIEQVKWKMFEINTTKEAKIKEFKEMAEIIKFKYKNKIDEELKRFNSKINSVNIKSESEKVVELNSKLEKKVDECAFIVDRSITNVLAITYDLFSDGELEEEIFLELKDGLEEEISLLNNRIENLKTYVEYETLIFGNYGYVAQALECVKESSIKYKSYIDEINAGLKKLLSDTLGVFQRQSTKSVNNSISRQYSVARSDLAYFLQENIEPERSKILKKKIIFSDLM